VGREAFEAARIEAGFPMFGHDITENNLPQEVSRNGRAISFTKGCYLGQETVARIDALGHVNKTLVGLRYLVSQVPKVGATILNGDEPVGTVTSATWSPKHEAPMALGYIRRGFNTPGTRLASHIGPTEVEVIALK
jgi:folate-binding protein YgfZ